MDVLNVAVKRGHGLMLVVAIAIAAFLGMPRICSAQEAESAAPANATSTAPDTNAQNTPAAAPAVQPPATPTASAPAEALTYVGADTCLACHNAQEKFKGTVHASGFLHKKGIDMDKSCETCHGPGSAHAAASGDRKNPGFASINNMKGSASAVNESCLKCHDDAAQSHWNGSVHEARGLSCLSCHSVHTAKAEKQLLKQASAEETCYQCHKDVKAHMSRSSHHPVKEGKMSCSDCHQPHGTEGAKLLTGGSVNETCFKCHAEKRGPMLFEHRPVSEDCSVCHVPHGSNHGKLLAQKTPFLCQSCHSNSRHPGTIYAANPATAGSNNYETLSNRAVYRNCLNCHSNIHGSNHPSGVYFVR